MPLRLTRRPHVLLVVFLMAVLAVFPLLEQSGAGRCGIGAGLMCIYMLGDTRATIDELFAAAAAFMLLALAWAAGFWCIEYANPGAFVSAHPVLPERKTWFDMATLSTTGFGDIVPVSTAARAAVILEQFVGVLYVALVISRLAGFAGRATRGLG